MLIRQDRDEAERVNAVAKIYIRSDLLWFLFFVLLLILATSPILKILVSIPVLITVLNLIDTVRDLYQSDILLKYLKRSE